MYDRFSKRTLSPQEIEDYIGNYYMPWRALGDKKGVDEEKRRLRAHM